MFAEIHNELFDALPFVVCTVGGCEQEPIDRPRGIGDHQVIWISEGAGVFADRESTYRLSKGEGMFFRRGVPHRYEAAEGGMRTEWCTFAVGEGLLDYYHLPQSFPFRVPSFLPAATRELRALCEGNSTIVSRSAAGYAWLTELLDALSAPCASAAERVRQYLENHYAEPLTLDEIAVQVRLSRYTLCRVFVREQGVTVMEQLKRIRIAKAKRFLRCTAWPVEEIGRLCGFESASYFGKRFREETGRSPREYRRAHR